jgi:hypothetical protein
VAARKAHARIKKEGKRHWEEWKTIIIPGLFSARNIALNISGANAPRGRRYSTAMSACLKKYGLHHTQPDGIHPTTRHFCFRILEEGIDKMDAWLKKEASERDVSRYNHPATIWPHYSDDHHDEFDDVTATDLEIRDGEEQQAAAVTESDEEHEPPVATETDDRADHEPEHEHEPEPEQEGVGADTLEQDQEPVAATTTDQDDDEHESAEHEEDHIDHVQLAQERLDPCNWLNLDITVEDAARILLHWLCSSTEFDSEQRKELLSHIYEQQYRGPVPAMNRGDPERITDLEWKLADATTEREALRAANTNLTFENHALHKQVADLETQLKAAPPETKTQQKRTKRKAA